MMYLYLFIAGVVGFFVGINFKKENHLPSDPEEIEKSLRSAREAVIARTDGRKDDIIEMMQNAVERHEELKACGIKAERRGINRQDVEDLLDVSEQTARKYLNELEEEGRIQQIGLSGRNVYYRLLEEK